MNFAVLDLDTPLHRVPLTHDSLYVVGGQGKAALQDDEAIVPLVQSKSSDDRHPGNAMAMVLVV